MVTSDGSKVLTLEGEIDLHVSPNVARDLQAMAKAKPPRLIVDLTRVSYIDSSGLAVLLDRMQQVEYYGGKFYLAGAGEGLRTVFESSRLDQVFRIQPDLESALQATV